MRNVLHRDAVTVDMLMGDFSREKSEKRQAEIGAFSFYWNEHEQTCVTLATSFCTLYSSLLRLACLDVAAEGRAQFCIRLIAPGLIRAPNHTRKPHSALLSVRRPVLIWTIHSMKSNLLMIELLLRDGITG